MTPKNDGGSGKGKGKGKGNWKRPKTPLPEIIENLDQEMLERVRLITHTEARYLVDSYYACQDYRKSLDNQIRAHVQQVDDQPAGMLTWWAQNMERMENQIKKALEWYAQSTEIGRWSMNIFGIGPVIAAGLIAHIDMDRAVTPGHIYSYAGIIPGVQWISSKVAAKLVEKIVPSGAKLTMRHAEELSQHCHWSAEQIWNFAGTGKNGKKRARTREKIAAAMARRPWNGSLKTLCWKIHQSFYKKMMDSNGELNAKNTYGILMYQRMQYENEKNERGDYRDQAAACLGHVRKTTESYAAYKKGLLPPSHIRSRAGRWAMKIFLSHWWEKAYEIKHGKKPPFQPYPLDHLGHTHKIEPPE